MIRSFTLEEVAELVSGRLIGNNVSFDAVCTDTRRIQRGELFVALNGIRFDGNQFLNQAKEKGACGAIVSEPGAAEIPQVLVKDTLIALRALAKANINEFHGARIAVTGSSGKTTVKEMLASILAQRGDVFATIGNFNNHIGLPLSVLNITDNHEFAVLELGASAEGEILINAQLVEPQVAIITNAGDAHLEGFGSPEAIVRTKGEILSTLTHHDTAILNLDDQAFSVWYSKLTGSRVFSFSAEGNAAADFYAEQFHLSVDASRFVLRHKHHAVEITLHVPGLHNVANALAAAAAAFSQGLSLDAIQTGLTHFAGVPHRLERRKFRDYCLLDDSYNSNPDSLKAALHVLAECGEQTLAVIGEMAELGAESARLHYQAGKLSASLGIQVCLGFGEHAEEIKRGFYDQLKEMEPAQNKAIKEWPYSEAFSGKAELTRALFRQLDRLSNTSTGCVLVKGSRAVAMEEVIASLEEREECQSGGAQEVPC